MGKDARMTGDRSIVRATVDGVPVEVPRGTSILEAAGAAGIEIPTLCYHPKVSVLGACRLCLVEVESLNKLIAACQTPVGEGMVIKTDTQLIRDVRQTMLELLLARHPTDCLACDKGGWCELQALTFKFGAMVNRFELEREEYVVRDASPYVERDTKKCVMCRRCIRVCSEVRGVKVWGAMYRGFDKKICTYFERPLDTDFQDPFNCEFCGSCIDICPVGALTAKPSKHKSRPWEVESAVISCPFCGVGCRVQAEYRRGTLVKTAPVKTEDGSLSDLCFRGRFATIYVNEPGRLTSCMIRKDGDLVPVGLDEAVRFAADRLSGGSGDLAAFIGTSASEKEAHALASLLSTVSPDADVFAMDSRGEIEEGHFWPARVTSSIQVEDLTGAGKLILIGQDFTQTHPVAGIRVREALRKGAEIMLMDPFDTLVGRQAKWWLRHPVVDYPAVLDNLAKAVDGGVESIAKKLMEYGGMDRDAWQGLLEWLKGAGVATIVVQKMPGGISGAIKASLSALTKALSGVGWDICYIPLDTNGYGVPLMLGAAGFRSVEAKFEKLVESEKKFSTVLSLRADPLKESWRREDWLNLRKKVDCWISLDPFLTETAGLADLVIPLPHFLEVEDSVMAAGGVGEFKPLLPEPEGVVPVPSFAGRVLEALGLQADFISSEFDVTAMRREGRRNLSRGYPRGEKQRALELSRIDPEEGGYLLSLRFHRFPGHRLRLVGARSLIGPWECVEMHPDDAAAEGLTDGNMVKITLRGSGFGFKLKTTRRVPRGQVSLPFDPEFETTAKLLKYARDYYLPAWGGITVKPGKG